MQRLIQSDDQIKYSALGLADKIRSSGQLIRSNPNAGRLLLACLVGIVFGLSGVISPILAIVLAIGIAVLLTSLSKPVLLGYLIIVAIILTSGIERGRFIPVFSINELGLLATVAIALLIVLIDKRRNITLPRYFWLALLVLGGGMVFIPILIYLLQGTQLTVNNAFKMVGPLQYFLLFWLFTVLPESDADRRKIIWIMLAMGAVVAVVGLMQGVGIGFVDRILNTFYASSHESMAARAGRITSLLAAWNSLGIFMMTILLICTAILFEIETLIGRLFTMGVMTLSLLCLLASGSYAGIIGTVIGVFLILTFTQRWTRSMPGFIVGFLVILLLILVFYPFIQPLIEKRLSYQFQGGGWMPQTISYRFKVWREIFIPAIKQHFPLAVAPTVPSYYAWQFEESQYILLLFRTGLAGFASFLLWIGLTIAWLYRTYRQSKGFDKALVSITLTLVIVLIVAGFTNEVFSFAGSIDYLWIMMGMIASSMVRT